jgi:hypothetical protein
MRTSGVVVLQVDVQVLLHLIYRLVELLSSHHAEVLVEKGPVKPLDKAIALRPTHSRGPVLYALELKEELVRMTIGATTELATIVYM